MIRLDSDIAGPMIVRFPIRTARRPLLRPSTYIEADSSIVEGKDVPHGDFFLTALKPKFDQAADRVDWR